MGMEVVLLIRKLALKMSYYNSCTSPLTYIGVFNGYPTFGS